MKWIAIAVLVGSMSIGLTSSTTASAPAGLEVTPPQLRLLVQEALFWEGVCAGRMPVATFPDPNGSAVIVCREPADGWVPLPQADWWPIYQRIISGG